MQTPQGQKTVAAPQAPKRKAVPTDMDEVGARLELIRQLRLFRSSSPRIYRYESPSPPRLRRETSFACHDVSPRSSDSCSSSAGSPGASSPRPAFLEPFPVRRMTFD